MREKINEIREKFLQVQIPLKHKEAFQFADEYISIQIENWITVSLHEFEKDFDKSLREKMIRIIENEQSHRKSINSSLILDETTDNEDFVYWEGILKKYVQRVLYLDRKKKDPKSSSLEVLYSVAAGAAMFFSLFFGFLFISSFEIYSIPFIVATVVVYMLKDRIKDNFQSISNKAVGLILPDNQIDIVDGFNQEIIGECKEKVSFLNSKKIPPEILTMRLASSRSPIEQKGKPESVILYKKKITLFNKRIEEFHNRRHDISDVTRFNIREFIKYCDDPFEFTLAWNQKTKIVEKLSMAKVYHINIIFKISSFKGDKIPQIFYRKYRVLLDQNGIKKVTEPEN